MAKTEGVSERRRYVRLDSVFPIRFRIESQDGAEVFCDWVQGFTHNISKGGFRLDVNGLSQQVQELLKNRHLSVSLKIRMPLNRPFVSARAKVAWLKDGPAGSEDFFIGLAYENIDENSKKRIINYARFKKGLPVFLFGLIFVLAAGAGFNGYLNLKLIKGNRALINQLVGILQEISVAKHKIKDINVQKDDLGLKLDALGVRMKTVEEEKAEFSKKAKQEEEKSSQRIKELNDMIEKLSRQKAPLQEELLVLENKENTVTEQLLRLDMKKVVLEKVNFDKMYRWLTVHQNPRTGLISSFEGDDGILDWAFIYDQSLVLQAYANFSDFERAQKILEFFFKRAKKQDGLFFNAYFAKDGAPAEYVIHSGPNIWLGIAVLQYTHKTQDPRYMRMAEEIARAVMRLQGQAQDGGIPGGPDLEWYSTEHNLDGYAFFNMLYKITQKQIYLDARDKVLKWLIEHTYDKVDAPIVRGKGDATIATDTYAWSIAAIGPEKLNALGMNPDKIIEFAEDNFVVKVSYNRPDGQNIEVKGFDFAPQRHLPRGGVVSTEWTAQMVMAFRITADFYQKKAMASKAKSFDDKADDYLTQLCNMIISSPSPSGQGEGCLPYASSDFVDTGHGWVTPKGKTTGSVSATAYTIFAYYRYNPLELN